MQGWMKLFFAGVWLGSSKWRQAFEGEIGYLGQMDHPKDQPGTLNNQIFNGCLVISNHFPCKDFESSNWNNHKELVVCNIQEEVFGRISSERCGLKKGLREVRFLHQFFPKTRTSN